MPAGSTPCVRRISQSPSRDLPDERAVGGVVVEMPPAAALAEPEKRSVLQPDRIGARVLPSLDPRLARFPEERFAARPLSASARLRSSHVCVRS